MINRKGNNPVCVSPEISFSSPLDCRVNTCISRPTGVKLSCHADRNQLHRDRSIEETKLRTLQLEKAMRWWSECTASWREKWATVRDERNQLREQLRVCRKQLEQVNQTLCHMQGMPREVVATGQFRTEMPNEPSLEFGSYQRLEESKKNKDYAKHHLDMEENIKCNKCQPTSWWQEQCDFLNNELHRLLESNISHWANYTRLMQENRLLRYENKRLSQNYASTQSIGSELFLPLHNPDIGSSAPSELSEGFENLKIDHINWKTEPTKTRPVEPMELRRQQITDAGEHTKVHHLQQRINLLLEERSQLQHRLEDLMSLFLETGCSSQGQHSPPSTHRLTVTVGVNGRALTDWRNTTVPPPDYGADDLALTSSSLTDENDEPSEALASSLDAIHKSPSQAMTTGLDEEESTASAVTSQSDVTTTTGTATGLDQEDQGSVSQDYTTSSAASLLLRDNDVNDYNEDGLVHGMSVSTLRRPDSDNDDDA